MQAHSRALLFAVAWAAPVAAQTLPNTIVNGVASTGVRKLPVVAAGDEANVYVAWQDSYDRGLFERNAIYVARSPDRGRTWLPEIEVSRSTAHCGQPQIAVRGPHVYVTWLDYRFGAAEVFFNRSTDRGATWLVNDVRINSFVPLQGIRAKSPTIAATGSSVFIAWTDTRDNALADRVWVDRSTDFGVTWTNDFVVDSTAAPWTAVSETPHIVADDPFVVIAWNDGREGAAGVYANSSSDGGLTWQPFDYRIDAAGTDNPGTKNVRLASVGPIAFAAWEDARHGPHGHYTDIFVNRTVDGGLTWQGTAQQISHPPSISAVSRGVAIALDAPNVYVGWSDTRDVPFGPFFDSVYVNRSNDLGATWQALETRLDAASPIGHSADLDLLASDGVVFAVWRDTRRGGADDVFLNYSRDGGATWLSSDIPLNSNPPRPPSHQSPSGPKLVASGATVAAVFEDMRDYQQFGASQLGFGHCAGALPYGTGLAGSGGFVPTLDVRGIPTVGRTSRLDIADALGGGTAALLFGFHGEANAPLLGGRLLVAPPVVPVSFVLGGATGVPGQGTVLRALSIPNDPNLIGERVHVQGFVIDPASPGGLSMTAGIELLIG